MANGSPSTPSSGNPGDEKTTKDAPGLSPFALMPPLPKPMIRKVLPPLLVAPKLMLTLAWVAVYGLVASLIFHRLQIPLRNLGEEITILNGIVLGVLLVFRNNAAYDRWWEGRKLWGQLVNDSRNLALAARSLANPPQEETREFGRILIGFAHALRMHLRGRVALNEIPGFENDNRRPAHVPAFLAHLAHQRIVAWRDAQRIDGFGLLRLHELAQASMNVCGACERIRTTPLAYSYRALLRHGTVIYTMLAPIYTVAAFGPMGLPVLMLVFYFLIGVEIAADDIEEPFGHDGDDLSLNAYCKVIESSVVELLLAEPGREAEARSVAAELSIPYRPSRPPEPMQADAS